MNEALRRLVREWAGQRCEYCLLPHTVSSVPFEMDHIIAQQHRGKSVPGNLALACFYCNSSKGPNLAGIDPVTRKLTRLFNPRRHKWVYHFRFIGPLLVGKTAIGRTTVVVLAMNDPVMVALRHVLMEEGSFPQP